MHAALASSQKEPRRFLPAAAGTPLRALTDCFRVLHSALCVKQKTPGPFEPRGVCLLPRLRPGPSRRYDDGHDAGARSTGRPSEALRTLFLSACRHAAPPGPVRPRPSSMLKYTIGRPGVKPLFPPLRKRGRECSVEKIPLVARGLGPAHFLWPNARGQALALQKHRCLQQSRRQKTPVPFLAPEGGSSARGTG